MFTLATPPDLTTKCTSVKIFKIVYPVLNKQGFLHLHESQSENCYRFGITRTCLFNIRKRKPLSSKPKKLKILNTNVWTILSRFSSSLILLESAPQTLSNDTKTNKIRPILIKQQQFEKLVNRFLEHTTVGPHFSAKF